MNPSKVLMNPSGSLAVVECGIDLSLIDTTNDSVTNVTLPALSSGFTLNPSRTTAYVLSGEWQVQVIDIATAADNGDRQFRDRASVPYSSHGQSPGTDVFTVNNVHRFHLRHQHVDQYGHRFDVHHHCGNGPKSRHGQHVH